MWSNSGKESQKKHPFFWANYPPSPQCVKINLGKAVPPIWEMPKKRVFVFEISFFQIHNIYLSISICFSSNGWCRFNYSYRWYFSPFLSVRSFAEYSSAGQCEMLDNEKKIETKDIFKYFWKENVRPKKFKHQNNHLMCDIHSPITQHRTEELKYLQALQGGSFWLLLILRQLNRSETSS